MHDEVYSGVKEIVFNNDDEVAKFYETMQIEGSFYNNQYFLLKHNGEIFDRYRLFNSRLIKVVKRKFKHTNVLLPLDDIQLCAYDALFCNDIMVVCLNGAAGTGKTKTALSVGLELLKQQVYDRILILRNPVFQGKEIGFSPGDKLAKFNDGGFSGSIIDNLDGSKFEFEDMVKKGLIDMDITSAIKGRNYKNTYIIADEAQDFLPPTVLGIGTRLNYDNCKVVFCSDLAQCANNKYLNNSGIKQLVDKARGQDWFAHIRLITNGRGKIATWFTNEYMN